MSIPTDPSSNSDIISPDIGEVTDGFILDKDTATDEDIYPPLDAPLFWGGDRGGTAIDPGPGTGPYGPDSEDESYDFSFEVDIIGEVNECGDSPFVGLGVSSSEDEPWWKDFTKMHAIVSYSEELSAELDKGNYGILSGLSNEDYREEVVLINGFNSASKSPIGGKNKLSCNLSFDIPSSKTYVNLHTLMCIDFLELNKKFNTDFPEQNFVVSRSSDILVASGQTNKTAMVNYSSGDKVSLSNIKIRDYSELNKMSNMDISLTSLGAEDLANPIRDFGISKNVSGNANFIFDLDIEAALKHSSLGSIFLKPITTGVKKDIISYATIDSMDIVRKRVDVKNDSEKVIASSSQKNSSMLLTSAEKRIRDREDAGGDLLGTLSEINMGGSFEIRTFTGTDYSLPKEGKYEYTVRVNMSDAVSMYLKDKLREISAATLDAVNWEKEISSAEYFDKFRNSFSYNGSRYVKKKYRNQNTPIENSIATYSEVFGDIFGGSNFDSKKIVDVLYPMVNSATGSPKGTQSVATALQVFQGKINNILGTKISIGQSGAERESSESRGRKIKSTLELSNTFSKNILDNTMASETGYIFINSTAESELGISTVSKESYERRLSEELGSYSKKEIVTLPEGISENTELSNSKLSALADLSATQASYLTPSFVVAEGDKIEISSAKTKWNNNRAASTVESIRASKKKMGTNKFFSFDLLASIGITCEIFDVKAKEGGTFVVDSAKDGNIFSTTEHFVSNNLEEDIVNFEEVGGKETMAISKSLSPLVTNNLSEDKQGTVNMANFDSNIEGNKLENLTLKNIKELPLQIKSLFLSRSSDMQENWLDSSTESVFDIGFNSIAQVEYLEYKKDSKGNMTSSWKILNPYRLSRAKNQSLRCRIRKYSNYQLGIAQKTDLDLPILNSQFIITVGDNINSYRTNRRNSTPRRMKRYLLQQNRVIRNDMKDISSIITRRN